MKLLYDLSATQAKKGILNHGGSEYAKAVFIKLMDYDPESVAVFYDPSQEMDPAISALILKHALNTLLNTEAISLYNFILEHKINIFYSALPKKEYSFLINKQTDTFKVIITIHGLRSLELPTDRFEWKYKSPVKQKIKLIYKQMLPDVYKKSLLKHFGTFLKSSKIITVSNHSKYSLLNFFPSLPAEKIFVFYSPIQSYFNDENSENTILKNLSILPGKYFLLLSGSLWTKNGLRAIKAFDKLLSENQEYRPYKMVVTGAGKSLFKTQNTENFIFTDFLNRSSLEYLFKNALSLVYPTLNEGFGYPPIEAMKYGVPVLASGIGPIPEVCADSAFYFNPLDETEIKIKLLFAIKHNEISSQENIQIRIARYNFIKERQEKDLTKMISLLLDLKT
jgi:glycosyltransferase involved in cell wall biosynthesis